MTKSIKPKTLEPLTLEKMSIECAKEYIEPEIRPVINQAKLIYKRLKSSSLNGGIGVSDINKLIYWKLNRQFNLIEKSLYENWPYFCYDEFREIFPNEFNPNTGIYWERERGQYEN